MNKNERPSFLKGRGAAVGIVICFVAVIALVGAYTFNNYQKDIDEQMAKAEEQAEKLAKDETEETTTDDIVLPEAEDDTETEDDMSDSGGLNAADVQEGRLAPEEITEEVYGGYLDTEGIPDPDLLIRTSGELRLSNYLVWQLAYTEFYFTDVPWPDFTKEELEKAIRQYNERDRRYGGVKEE